ncbi:hypothetical protein TRICI_003274 [Trichomonascus ciferrii]|uniref:Uncharacterized protein n=1 Tax=Trichomonascus ciferrii TaxID=44093 RepID=A0A642V3K6_9ASCO|nr:hypothetical protein TRICI_003274 [Trichomonascus ciferrii]
MPVTKEFQVAVDPQDKENVPPSIPLSATNHNKLRNKASRLPLGDLSDESTSQNETANLEQVFKTLDLNKKPSFVYWDVSILISHHVPLILTSYSLNW